jgi:outer membrane protein assembly factor BamD
MRSLFLPAILVLCVCEHAQKPDSQLEAALAQESPDAVAEFRKGMDALSSDNWEDATKIFEHIKTKYPFSGLAPLAELKLADTRFARDQIDEAEDAYKSFVKLHPNHPRTDYAAYRAAFCDYKNIPSDYFFLPPSIEKEQTHVKNALLAVNAFLALYPKSQYRDDAMKVREDCRQRLAEHEMYVADFYEKRKRLPAVAGRLETIIRDYPGVELEPEAMLKLVQTYIGLKQVDKGKAVLQRLIEKYPSRPERHKAEALLKDASSPDGGVLS